MPPSSFDIKTYITPSHIYCSALKEYKKLYQITVLCNEIEETASSQIMEAKVGLI